MPRDPGNVDGTGIAARFLGPFSVAVDSTGSLYVADYNNHRISKGTPLFRFDSSIAGVTISNGLFQARLTGPFGSNVVVESSGNLQAWTPVQTNALTPDGLGLSLPLET